MKNAAQQQKCLCKPAKVISAYVCIVNNSLPLLGLLSQLELGPAMCRSQGHWIGLGCSKHHACRVIFPAACMCNLTGCRWGSLQTYILSAGACHVHPIVSRCCWKIAADFPLCPRWADALDRLHIRDERSCTMSAAPIGKTVNLHQWWSS